MRKSFHTLSGIITDAVGQDPCNGNVYIFINRDRIKLLHWEPGGMVLYSKLLEAGTLGKPDSASKYRMAGTCHDCGGYHGSLRFATHET